MKRNMVLFFIACASTINAESSWAERTLKKLSRDEKIGQLFVIAAVSDEELNKKFMQEEVYTMDTEHVSNMISRHHVGGVIFLGMGTPEKQVERTQQFQQLSKIPLLICQDLEWGLSMRLHNTVRFPRNMTLGALNDDTLIYRMGYEIGRQARALGVHMNLAPVVDVNNNPKNPVINNRSFGSDPQKVTRKAIAYMRGLRDAGILSCAKHFPGHGDTTIDSHEELPRIDHSAQRLDAIELYPYKQIAAQTPAIMTAHLHVPALESAAIPSSCSRAIVTNLLRNKMQFHGLIITDGLGMRGVTNSYKPGELELHALLAGNDILLCPIDIPVAIATIKQAFADGRITEQELDARVLRILRAKEWALQQPTTITKEPLQTQLHTPRAYALKQQLYEHAMTIACDNNQQIPLGHDTPCALLVCGSTQETVFEKTITQQKAMPVHRLQKNPTSAECHLINTQLKPGTTVIVALTGMTRSAQDQFGIDAQTQQFIRELDQDYNIVLVLFGSPYSIDLFNYIPTTLVAYEDDSDAQRAAAHVLRGKVTARGKMPV